MVREQKKGKQQNTSEKLVGERLFDPLYGMDLFNYDSDTRSYLRQVQAQYQSIPRSLGFFKASNGNFVEEGKKTVDNLLNAAEKANFDFYAYSSSYTTGAAYLRIREDLLDMEVDEEEIYRMFKGLLKINTAIAEIDILMRPRLNEDRLQMVNRNRTFSKGRSYLLQAVDENPIPTPPWFKGGQKAWDYFLITHCHFGLVLHPEEYAPLLYNQPLKMFADRHVRTFNSQYPDWFDFRDPEPPDINRVKEEMEEDLGLARVAMKSSDQSNRKIEVINELSETKIIRINSRLEKIRRVNIASVSSLGELLLFLDSVQELYILDEDPAVIYKMSPEEHDRRLTPPDGSIVQQINSIFGKGEIISDPQVFTLWLAKKLHEAKFDISTPGEAAEALATFKEVLNGASELNLDEVMGKLRARSGRSFNVFKHEICELLDLLSVGEVEELVRSVGGSNLPDFVSRLSNTIVGNRKRRLQANSSSEPQIMLKVKNEVLNWVKNNWKLQSEKLLDRLADTSQDRVQVAEQEPAVDVGVAEELDDTQNMIEQMQTNKLDEWEVFYSPRPNLDQSRFVRIIGATLSERSEWFRSFVGVSGVPSTEDPAVIIRSLNQIYERPKQDLMQRYKHYHDGIEFYKEKVDPWIRILYVEDRTSKRIVFYIYRKEDRSYRKLDRKN